MNTDKTLPENWLGTAIVEAQARVDRWPAWKKTAMQAMDLCDRPKTKSHPSAPVTSETQS